MNSHWNRVASTLRSTDISNSGFGDRPFAFSSPPTLENVGHVDCVIAKSVLVEITLLSQAVQKLLPLPFQWPPALIFSRRRPSYFSWRWHH
jgi:hypothetical protein